MSHIRIEALKQFCKDILIKEGMNEEYAGMVAEVLGETDAYGIFSHGTKNLHNYIKKFRVGGIDIKGRPEIVTEGSSYAVIDAHKTLGMIPSVIAMRLACKKAEKNGIALVTVRNSCHFGAAGYYANLAAMSGFIGLSMSNVDPNMAIPGAKGKAIGNNPFSYAAPAKSTDTIFLDIAMSNVASLKVVQARKDGRQIPDTWIVDKDGRPTTDPSKYPEEGAMQPMAAHKGYGLAVMVELLTGILSGGCTSMSGDIVSWCFEMDKPNNVCHAFLAINPKLFLAEEPIENRVEAMVLALRNKPKAQGTDRIYTPGEVEWDKHRIAENVGIALPPDVESSLLGLAEEIGISLPISD